MCEKNMKIKSTSPYGYPALFVFCYKYKHFSFLAVVEDVNGLLRKNMILYSGTFIMLTERMFQMG